MGAEAAKTAAEAAGTLSELGIVAILLFLFLLFTFFGIGGMCYIGKRLFGPEGVAERVAASHIAFMTKLDGAVTEIVYVQKKHEETSRKTDSSIRRLLILQGVNSQTLDTFRMVWRRNIKVLRAIALKLNLDDSVTHLDEMESLLDVGTGDETTVVRQGE